MLTANEKAIVVQVLEAINVVPGQGNTLDGLINKATYTGKPLSAVAKRKIRAHLRKAGLKAPPKASARPSYSEAIEYLAHNDDFGIDFSKEDPTVCMSMIAHLFGKEDRKVVEDVLAYRDKHDL